MLYKSMPLVNVASLMIPRQALVARCVWLEKSFSGIADLVSALF